MASEDGGPKGGGDLVELRPAPAVLLRHRDAVLEVVTAPRAGPRVELKRGALWIRAGEEGPGVTVTHGASSVQVRAGAGVVEVSDMEALLVVASGRAAVKGVSPLPRSVIAGQAVTLTLDGTFTDPDVLSAAELAADRMVVENLALDNLASAPSPADPSAAPPVPPRTPAGEARVDPPGAPLVEPTGDPFAPRVRPESDPEPSAEPIELIELAELAEPAGPGSPSPAPPPLPETPAPPPVGRPAPSLPPAEPSFLETALANVGVTDAPRDPVEALAPAASPTAAPAERDRATAEAPPERPADDERRRQRILVALVVGALLILALVAAVAFSA